MANYIRRYPGENANLVAQLMKAKEIAARTGQVNPDLAPIVAGSMEDTRARAMEGEKLSLAEKYMTLEQQKQAAKESQFAQSLAQSGQQFTDTLALNKDITENEISAANRMREGDWLNLALKGGLLGGYGYLANKKRKAVA
jgi:hypothetical protein